MGAGGVADGGSGGMSGTYEVFQRKGATDPMTHVGSVNAEDTRMALLLAKECFFRRDYPTEIWVACREDLHPLVERDVLEPGSDKSYRAIEAYTGIAKKRERVEALLRREQAEASLPRAQLEVSPR